MKFKRLYHRIYAWWFGYFWLPCPVCGEYFGGHEWGHDSRGSVSLLKADDPARGKGVCSNSLCISFAQVQNALVESRYVMSYVKGPWCRYEKKDKRFGVQGSFCRIKGEENV
jgi:hypothetical protein